MGRQPGEDFLVSWWEGVSSKHRRRNGFLPIFRANKPPDFRPPKCSNSSIHDDLTYNTSSTTTTYALSTRLRPLQLSTLPSLQWQEKERAFLRPKTRLPRGALKHHVIAVLQASLYLSILSPHKLLYRLLHHLLHRLLYRLLLRYYRRRVKP